MSYAVINRGTAEEAIITQSDFPERGAVFAVYRDGETKNIPAHEVPAAWVKALNLPKEAKG